MLGHIKLVAFPENLERLDFSVNTILPGVLDLKKCEKLEKLYISEYSKGALTVVLPKSKRFYPNINIHGKRNIVYENPVKTEKESFKMKPCNCVER